MQNFTHDDFIRHCYEDLKGEETITMNALFQDLTITQKSVEEFSLPFSYLMEIKTEISEKALGKIIQYAKKMQCTVHLN